MSDLNEFLPAPDVILDLEPEDLAGILVEFFHSIPFPSRMAAKRIGSAE